MTKTKNVVLIILAMLLVATTAIFGTLAWLTARTGTITNTFVKGQIELELIETPNDYKLVPGNVIAKDPAVWVKPGSEPCYIFVEITKTNDLDRFVNYTVASGWTRLEVGATGQEGLTATMLSGREVYYRQSISYVEAGNTNVKFNILADNKVTVPIRVTEEELDALGNGNNPTLSFTAYACQSDNIPDTAEKSAVVYAWEQVSHMNPDNLAS